MTIEEIEKNLPNGFHDASLRRIEIDYIKREVLLDLKIDIGNSEYGKEDYRAGRLTLSGLVFCIIETPDLKYEDLNIKGLWITGSDPISSRELLKNLSLSLPEGAFVHRFYISNWNAAIFLAATEAYFKWI